jgi:DNA-binding MarR family transcriptional regulator
LEKSFSEGAGPQKLSRLCGTLKLSGASVEVALEYLERKGWVVRTRSEKASGEDLFVITRSIHQSELRDLLKDHLQIERIARFFDVDSLIDKLKGSKTL